jgi:hypothetical protein
MLADKQHHAAKKEFRRTVGDAATASFGLLKGRTKTGIWLRFAKTAFGAIQRQCDTSMLIGGGTTSPLRRRCSRSNSSTVSFGLIWLEWV